MKLPLMTVVAMTVTICCVDTAAISVDRTMDSVALVVEGAGVVVGA